MDNVVDLLESVFILLALIALVILMFLQMFFIAVGLYSL